MINYQSILQTMKVKFPGSLLVAGGCISLTSCIQPEQPEPRPDIIWIIAEDMSADFSCYGSEEVSTPHIDRLAEESVQFMNCFVTSPVCSPSRSALLTGRYPTTTGAHNHRSSRGEVKIFLPEDTRTIPDLFREAGYFTANCGYDYPAKTDYNIVTPPDLYDASLRLKPDNSNWNELWQKNSENRPVFLQLQLFGGKNRSYKPENPVDPKRVKLPPYYPDTEIFRNDRANYLNTVIYTDLMIRNIVEYLKSAGRWENSLVFFITDHGEDNYRHKQFLYDGGIHIPMLLKLPEGNHFELKASVEDLLIHIDMAATSLDAAGIKLPDYLEGQSLISEKYSPREYVISARDRCDWTPDRIRSVRTREYKYICNFRPDLSHMQSNYRDHWPTVQQAWKMFSEGDLQPVQSVYFEDTRPGEELYYIPEDPDEIHNLAGTSEYTAVLEELRTILEDWIQQSGDLGQYAESEKSYSEALKNVNTGSTLEGFPFIAGLGYPYPDGEGASGKIYFYNTSDRPLNITGNLGIIKPSTGELEIGADSDITLTYSLEPEYKEGQKLSFHTVYMFSNGHETDFSTDFYVKKPVMYEFKNLSSLPVIDGKVNEMPLDINVGEDARFDMALTRDFLYIAAVVQDEDVHSDENVPSWEQDGIEIRLDYRPDPFRSNSKATREFLDHLVLIVSPSKNGQALNFYKPAQASRVASELFGKNGLKYACRNFDDRYEAEFLIPLRFIREKQGDDWEAIRINFTQHDLDGKEQKRIEWKPKWGSMDDYVGSGTFFRSGGS